MSVCRPRRGRSCGGARTLRSRWVASRRIDLHLLHNRSRRRRRSLRCGKRSSAGRSWSGKSNASNRTNNSSLSRRGISASRFGRRDCHRNSSLGRRGRSASRLRWRNCGCASKGLGEHIIRWRGRSRRTAALSRSRRGTGLSRGLGWTLRGSLEAGQAYRLVFADGRILDDRRRRGRRGCRGRCRCRRLCLGRLSLWRGSRSRRCRAWRPHPTNGWLG